MSSKQTLSETLDPFTRAYMACALWSSTDDDGEPLDGYFTLDELSSACADRMIRDCAAFQRDNAEDLACGADAQAGRDFWLTRNRHGCGFWGGDWPEPQGARLTYAARAYGETYLYVEDDGLIYCHPG